MADPSRLQAAVIRPRPARIEYFALDQDQFSAIRFIQKRTVEGEYLFVGTKGHHRILINDVLFCFASERRSVTKWHQFDPGVRTTMEVQSEIIGEFRKRSRHYVVRMANWENVNEPNGSAISSGVTVLDDYLKATYQTVARFGMIEIAELRERIPPGRVTSDSTIESG